MRKTLYILCLLTASIAINAQTDKTIKIYQKGGDVDSVTINNGMSLSHSNERINGGLREYSEGEMSCSFLSIHFIIFGS